MKTYKITVPRRGIKVIPVYEFGDTGLAERMALELHEGSRPDSIDIVQALQRAHEGGREDRAEEILGDAGLGRAAAEVGAHGYATLGPLDCTSACRCGRFEGGTIEQWRRHLAYEILQAAARLP